MKKLLLILLLSSQFATAQEWEKLILFDVKGYFFLATTELENPNQKDDELHNYKYGAVNLFDGDFSTAWVEGVKGDGVGESVFISVPYNCKTINIHNGYGKSESLLRENNRVKRLKLTCYAGINPTGHITEIAYAFKTKLYPKDFYIDLQDVDSIQTFNFPFTPKELIEFKEQVKNQYLENFTEPIYQMAIIVKLEIEEVYKGTKYDDTCISEIFYNDSFVADYRHQQFKKVENIYIDESNEGRVLIDTPNQKGIVIIEDPESVFQVIDISIRKKWATIIRMPANSGEGRVETEYLLVNTHLGKIMNEEIEKTSGNQLYSPLFIVEKKGVVILEHTQGEIRLR